MQHCAPHTQQVTIVETSAAGNKLRPLQPVADGTAAATLTLDTGQRFQQIVGFGGSFTEAGAYLLQRLSPANRARILQAYFGADGSRYSLTRTHINSCDFSLGQYAYANVPGDTALAHFSIEEDRPDLLPMIKEAQRYSKEGFKIIASPWTAPPWMKDNNHWVGGKLLPQYRATWALYFAKYIQAYRQEGVDIWGITVENEPLGNGNNWESMYFTPAEMGSFVRDFLAPRLKQEGLGHVKILGYDQNRGEELEQWARELYGDAATAAAFDGMAVHWYASTYDYFPASLQYTHRLAPDKHLINTEACVDAQVPRWKDDAWYWRPEATDWGYTWAPAEQIYLHPKYEPVYRYARDIIGCLNNYVDGWIDWNMVLDRQGGPNWFKNWCTAPVIVDPEADEVYFTPLYYTLAHFSRYIRPGAVRIGWNCSDADLQVTAAQNPDGSVVAVVFNPTASEKMLRLLVNGTATGSRIAPAALQTIVFKPKF